MTNRREAIELIELHNKGIIKLEICNAIIPELLFKTIESDDGAIHRKRLMIRHPSSEDIYSFILPHDDGNANVETLEEGAYAGVVCLTQTELKEYANHIYIPAELKTWFNDLIE